jgi:LytS/YehU family sensor histidine kinase
MASLWTALAVLDATQNILHMRQAGMHHAWVKLFFVLIVEWLPWALVTPLVIKLARRFPPDWKSPKTWLLHLAAVMAINLLASAWSLMLEIALQPWLPDFDVHGILAAWPLRFADRLLPALILYAFIIAITDVLDSKAKAAAQQTDAARLNEQLSDARLNALQRQIEPHFIFNTLNSISGLVREHKNEAAVSMIANFSDLLRRVATGSNEPEVTLAHEVEFLKKYLAIQEARFAGRLKFEFDIPPGLQDAQIPNLLLQPLLENALKHGIASQARGGTVRVAATCANGLLELRVYNDGPLLSDDRQAVKEGIGLSNLRTRLKLLHGERGELRLENRGVTGVEAFVALPFKVA